MGRRLPEQLQRLTRGPEKYHASAAGPRHFGPVPGGCPAGPGARPRGPFFWARASRYLSGALFARLGLFGELFSRLFFNRRRGPPLALRAGPVAGRGAGRGPAGVPAKFWPRRGPGPALRLRPGPRPAGLFVAGHGRGPGALRRHPLRNPDPPRRPGRRLRGGPGARRPGPPLGPTLHRRLLGPNGQPRPLCPRRGRGGPGRPAGPRPRPRAARHGPPGALRPPLRPASAPRRRAHLPARRPRRQRLARHRRPGPVAARRPAPAAVPHAGRSPRRAAGVGNAAGPQRPGRLGHVCGLGILPANG